MVSSIVLRRVLMTGAVVGVTVTGTLYGAGMKMEQEVKQEAQKRETATIDETIQTLEARRKRLVTAKEGFEKQIQTLEEKREKMRAEQLQQQSQHGQQPGQGPGQKRGE